MDLQSHYSAEYNNLPSDKTASGYEKAKVEGDLPKVSTMELSEDKRNENIKKLYREKTEPINVGGRFAGGYRDDSYYASFTIESQKIEKEVFYDEAMEQQEMDYEPTTDKRCTKFDTEKLNKILVGVYLIWEDDKFDTLFPKLKLLVEAKADITTTLGSGIISSSLLQRTFYGKHEKLRHGLINLADSESLEPRADQSLFSVACEMCSYNTMKLLLTKNCEPNRMDKWGKTPLMKLCMYSTYKGDNTDYVEQLKCIELLLSFEGPDAKTLKAKWIRKWENNCPESIGSAWREIADFCIPNINVRPSDNKWKTAKDHLLHYQNPDLFITGGKQLLDHLFDDARCNKEKYWPRDRNEYKKLFKSNWE